jgi:hypothetical protein
MLPALHEKYLAAIGMRTAHFYARHENLPLIPREISTLISFCDPRLIFSLVSRDTTLFALFSFAEHGLLQYLFVSRRFAENVAPHPSRAQVRIADLFKCL